MSSETTYAGALGDLRRLDAALEANLAEIPHLQGARERTQLLLTGAHEAARQQAELRAAKQEVSQQLKTLVLNGKRVAHAVRSLLKEHYGLRSEKLAEFGIQPFRGRPFRTETRGRRKMPAASETPASPPAVPTDLS